jgi:GT2 family glycosyltransferase
MMMPKVAVVILNFNTVDFLKQFLKHVVATNYSNLEVVLIDNASSDDSVAFVKHNFGDVKIIQLENNYGFTGGYNRGLKQVEADYYVLLNSDVEVDENWLQPLVDLAESDKNIAAIQPKILDYKNKTIFEYAGASGGYIDQYGFPFCRGRIFESIEQDLGQYNDIKQIFGLQEPPCL